MTLRDRYFKPLSLITVAAFIMGLPLVAQTPVSRYILEVVPGINVNTIAPKYGLTVLHSWTSSKYWSSSVSSEQPLSPNAIARLTAERGVLELEVDAIVQQPESEVRHQPQGNVETLGNWFPLTTSEVYYGVRVHTGYVHQPMTAIVALGPAHARFGLGSGIVAVIDTGVDPSHAALRDVLIPGYDFTRDRSDTVSEMNDLTPDVAARLQQSTVEILDGMKHTVLQVNPSAVALLNQSTVEILDGKRLPSAFGHGTMVAGLVHLVAPEARIMPLKAFRADGSASLSDIVRAIHYATDHGANVISMSFSFSQASLELQWAIDYATTHGVLCVASAGNNGKEVQVYPASFKGVVGVGSTNYSDRRSPFSNYGSSARTSAPGEALVTLFPGNTYAGVWGTSFSTALVSGAMTLFRQSQPNLNFEKAFDVLDYGVRVSQDMGDARLELLRSLNYLAVQR